jgi:nucleoside 2-deoxyribosyltransferase
MTITICGSITHLPEMEQLEQDLLKLGFSSVLRPVGFGGGEREKKNALSVEEDGQREIEHDFINKHWQKILKSDCILVANYEKKGIQGYVGGNTFLEMGFAFVLGKPIFMINSIPEVSYTSEMIGMQPTVIDGKLRKITEYYQLQ